MDRVVVAIASDVDVQTVRRIVQDVGLNFPQADFWADIETAPGLRQFKNIVGICEVLFLVLHPNDNSSSRVTQETFESVVIKATQSRLESLVRALGQGDLVSDVWLFFVYSWSENQEIVYYEGDASAFSCHLKLNGGAFRTTYNVIKKTLNIDLDTPLVWKVVRAGEGKA
jgi:hypothetical protein